MYVFHRVVRGELFFVCFTSVLCVLVREVEAAGEILQNVLMTDIRTYISLST